MLVQNSIERIKEFVQRLFSPVVEEGLGTVQIERIQRKGCSAFRSATIKKFQPDSKVVIINVHIFGYRVEIFFTRSNVGMTMDVAPALTRAFEVEFPKKPAPMRKKRGQVLVGGPRIYFGGSKEQHNSGTTRSVGSHWVDVRPAIQGEHGTSLVAFPLWNAQVPPPQKVEEVRPADPLPPPIAPAMLEECPVENIVSVPEVPTIQPVPLVESDVSEVEEKKVVRVRRPRLPVVTRGAIRNSGFVKNVLGLLHKLASKDLTISMKTAAEAITLKFGYNTPSARKFLMSLKKKGCVGISESGRNVFLHTKFDEERILKKLFR